MDLKSAIRNVQDFPKKGIGFKDITTLLKDPRAFDEAVKAMSDRFLSERIDTVVGIESRGFIFGGAVAVALDAGFVPARKPGKLPSVTLKETYDLEYGTDAVEIHKDAIEKGSRVLVVDDLLATGGTAAAVIRLVRRTGGTLVGAAFLIELDFLGGRKKLEGVPIHVLIHFRDE